MLSASISQLSSWRAVLTGSDFTIIDYSTLVNKGSTRIKDIALKANVSVGTVDRVLHNRGRVAEEVRQKVLQIAAELKYEPNLIARTLGANRTYQIAALIPAAEFDPYWQQPINGIEQSEKELRRYGIRVNFFFYDQHNVQSFLEQASRISLVHPDGILTAPLFYRESLGIFEEWKQRGIPFVFFNTHIPEYEPLSYVGQDSYQSGLLAGKLLHYGQTAPATFLIAHIAEDFANSPHLIKKEQGFRDYFKQNGLTEAYSIIHADLADSLVEKQLAALLATNPAVKGIFVTTSKAYLIAPFLSANQPRSIRLVGYDLLKNNLKHIQEGAIDFIINQNPTGQGFQGISCLADFLVFKKQVSPIRYLPLDIITRENLGSYTEAVV